MPAKDAPHLLKPIELCRSLSEIETRAQISKEEKSGLLKNDFKSLSAKLSRMRDEGALNDKGGDEERAFIFYFRACEIGKFITTKHGFKDFCSKYKGTAAEIHNNYKSSLTRFAELQTSLERRYDLKHVADNVQSVPNGVQQDSAQKDVMVVDESAPKKEEVFELTPKEIKSHLDKKCSILILDFRDESVIDAVIKPFYTPVVHIPPHLLKRGCIYSHLTKGIRLEDRYTFTSGQKSDYIVLMDKESTYADMKMNTKIQILYDALYMYNNDSNLMKRPPVVLKGGFDNFMLHFPMFVQKIERKQSVIEEPSLEMDVQPIEMEGEEPGLESFIQPRFPEIVYPNLKALEKERQAKWERMPVDEVMPMETKEQESMQPILIKPQKPQIPDRNTKPVFLVAPAKTDTSGSVDEGYGTIDTKSDAAVVHKRPIIDRSLKPLNLPNKKDENSLDAEGHLNAAQLMNGNLKHQLEIISQRLDDTKQSIEVESIRHDTAVPDRPPASLVAELSESKVSLKPSESLRTISPSDSNVCVSGKENLNAETKPLSENNSARSSKPLPDRSQKRMYLDELARKRNNTDAVLGEIKTAYAALLRDSNGYNSRSYPMGLHNLKNTCFMNAVLQCLYYTADVRKYFIQVDQGTTYPPFTYDVNSMNRMGSGGRMAANMASLFLVLSERRNKTLRPTRFKGAVILATQNFDDTRQHDAQEFLALLIDALHEDLNLGSRKHSIPEQNNVNLLDSEFEGRAESAWQNYQKHTWSKLYDFFTGQLVSTMQCETCEAKSMTFDIFTQITAEIPQNGGSLEDCLQSHLKKEYFCEPVWNCPVCRVKRSASKQIKLWRLPKYIIIHLKRFKPCGDYLIKNDSSVSFPETLSPDYLYSYMHQYSNQALGQYHLYAVVHHSGNLQHGHYTCTARENKSWYHFNDEEVSSGNVNLHMAARTGYLLFYERQDV